MLKEEFENFEKYIINYKNNYAKILFSKEQNFDETILECIIKYAQNVVASHIQLYSLYENLNNIANNTGNIYHKKAKFYSEKMTNIIFYLDKSLEALEEWCKLFAKTKWN